MYHVNTSTMWRYWHHAQMFSKHLKYNIKIYFSIFNKNVLLQVLISNIIQMAVTAIFFTLEHNCNKIWCSMEIELRSCMYLMVYPSRWSVWGSTNRDLADNSHALHRDAALSAATTSSPTTINRVISHHALHRDATLSAATTSSPTTINRHLVHIMHYTEMPPSRQPRHPHLQQQRVHIMHYIEMLPSRPPRHPHLQQ